MDDISTTDILKNIKIKNVNRLVIGHLNINSIRGKFESLKEIIQNYIDILVVSESKLDESFPPAQFKIDGYDLPYRKDRNKNGGGVMIFVREDLACKEVKDISDKGEGTFLKLNLRKAKWLYLGDMNITKLILLIF